MSPRERATFVRAGGLALVITLFFAAPATLALWQGQLAPTEPRLGTAIARAFGGITLPLVAAALVASLFGVSSPVRAHLDRLVAAGAEPRAVILRPLVLALVAAVAATALGSMLTVVLLRVALRLGSSGLLVQDALGTAWGSLLGVAAWIGLAAPFVLTSGRPARAFVVVAIDLLTRLLPGGAAWLAPSAHVENVLGAPPPRGFIHVPVLPQLASVSVLLLLAALGLVLSVRRYQGPPAR